MNDYPPPDESRGLQRVISEILADPRRQDNIRAAQRLLTFHQDKNKEGSRWGRDAASDISAADRLVAEHKCQHEWEARARVRRCKNCGKMQKAMLNADWFRAGEPVAYWKDSSDTILIGERADILLFSRELPIEVKAILYAEWNRS